MAVDGMPMWTIEPPTSSVSRGTAANSAARFAKDGLEPVWQKSLAKGRGRKPSIPDATIEKIVTPTSDCRPEGETHWSTRTMAGVAGVSKSTVQRTWKEVGLKPHRVDTLKVVQRPQVRGGAVDAAGRRTRRRTRSCCAPTTSSPRQALDRTQASLPMTGALVAGRR